MVFYNFIIYGSVIYRYCFRTARVMWFHHRCDALSFSRNRRPPVTVLADDRVGIFRESHYQTVVVIWMVHNFNRCWYGATVKLATVEDKSSTRLVETDLKRSLTCRNSEKIHRRVLQFIWIKCTGNIAPCLLWWPRIVLVLPCLCV